MLAFEPLDRHRRGLIEQLLTDSYAPLLAQGENDHVNPDRWRQADRDAFDNPDTIGQCTFITCLGGIPIGFGSFDPRQGPELGTVGQNCILPEYRGHGYGKRQLEEILRQLQDRRIRKAAVTTGEHPFFTPARAMYLACGFRETKRCEQDDLPFRVVEYEKQLTS